MASLDKLAIRGIRSFDDKSVNIIQFMTPLTVIVGYNGSGKTTIIECLKYATTGDLPPNTKGGAFVHDPKMANENEVKAQVRLRFFSANKTRMNCVRSLQVTQKRGGGLTMKTLEGILQIDDGQQRNKRGTISTKCSELDEEIPRLLGVSRSILENVIFCHQEESNWPLSEPASLKKKFDDIFEATRYTKALDSIKALRKERTAELKVAKAELEALKTDKERADGIKRKVESFQRSLTEKEDRLEELDAEISKTTAQNKIFYEQATKFREILNKAEMLEDKQSTHKRHMDQLRMDMTEINESDDELQRRKDSFAGHLTSQANRKNQMLRKIDDKQDEQSQLQRKHGAKLTEQGKLEAERASHEQAIKDREELIRKISNDLGIKGFDIEGLSDEQIEDFMQRLQDQSRKQDSELAKIKNDSAQQDAEITARIQSLTNEDASRRSSKDSHVASIKALTNRISSFHDNIDAVQVSEFDVSVAEKEQDEVNSRLEILRNELVEAKFEDRIKEHIAKIRELEDKRDSLNSDLTMLNKQADTRAKLSLKRSEIQNKREGIQALIDRHNAKFKDYTGAEAKADVIETEITRAMTAKERDLARGEREDHEKNKVLQQVESALTFARNQQKEKKSQMTAIEKEVAKILAGEEFDNVQDAVKAAEEEVTFNKEQLGIIQYASTFFTRVMKTGKEKRTCMACNRGISDSEFAAFEAFVQDSIRRSQPSKKAELEEELKGWTEQLTLYQSLLPKESQAKAIREREIPALEAQVAAEEAKLQTASAEAEATSSQLAAIKADLRELQSLKRIAADISRMLGEIESVQKDLTSLENDLASTGTAQTVDDLQAQIADIGDNIKRAKRELQSQQNERDSKRNLIANAEKDAHQAEMKLVHKRQSYNEREALQKRIEEAKAEIAESQEKVKALDEEIKGAQAPIRKTKDERDQLRADMAKRENEAQGKASRLRHCLDNLEGAEKAVTRYIRHRGAQRLRDCEDAIADLAMQMKADQDEIANLTAEVAKIDKDLNASKATERNISDNIRYREMRREIEEFQREIASLNLDEAARSNRTFTEKYDACRRKENELNGEAAHIGGEISSLRSQIEGREQELKEDYRDVHKRFTAKLIHVKTSEMANNDLEKYAKALENAIMRYHAIKMEEINEQIKYLWSKTYQGTDIDTISIKSDNENARGNRSYNYRVCMVKDTVEMDMRGRCSAGQKVLASIIIRLALADSFGNNCGILALDEPTTNLDKENIEALASSLADIIKERRHQSNFQLIVITHDEDFLNKLGQSDVLDYYWRVSRDHHQKSIIERNRIRQL